MVSHTALRQVILRHRLPLALALGDASPYVGLRPLVATYALRGSPVGHVKRPVGGARLPRQLRLHLTTLPEEVGTKTPQHTWAKAASLLGHFVSSPTVTKWVAAMSMLTLRTATRLRAV